MTKEAEEGGEKKRHTQKKPPGDIWLTGFICHLRIAEIPLDLY